MIKIFISYTHIDETFRKQLDAHLSPLVRNGSLQIWHDRKLLSGDELDTFIMGKLEECDLFLALVSPEFIASDYCYNREFARARERNNQGNMRLLPVILRACQWKRIPALASLLAAPKDGRAVASWPDRDEAWEDVTNEIQRIIDAAAQPKITSYETAAKAQNRPLASAIKQESLSNSISGLSLNIPRRAPSDRERDTFRLQSFETIYSIFENSIADAMSQGEVEGQIRQIDANRFSAILYLDGKKVSAITIMTGARGLGGNGISYVNQEDANSNTANGWYTIGDKDGDIYFETNAFLGGGARARQLTAPDVASEIWESFTSSLSQARR